MSNGNQSDFIRIENIVKKFGTVTAVQSISLNIHQGEVFCLLGGSGSGKSTLLRMLAGFDQPTEGRIILDGEEIAGRPPEKLPVNMMFQSYALFPHMSVEKNVAYGLRRDGVAKAEVKQRVDEILDMVKLTPFAKRRPHQLSGGQRQRVALARCIVKRPKVLMLDEPLGALDKKLREETQQELLKIQRELGLTFIVVTHDQEEAMTMADRIGIMDMGKLVQVGPPRELYENPNSLFIADFVGSLNKFDGTVVGQDDGRTVVRLSEDLVLKIETPFEHNKGEDVMLTTRPEKLEIFPETSSAQPSTQNVVTGRVSFVGYMGEQTNYSVDLGHGIEVRVAEQNHHMSTKISIAAGDTVRVAWPARASHLFAA
ncbi:ABC transporter ATP-binding protein [Roseibium sp. SCP14]|uniref:ABC transporter ATP-binding protein n=1 Tax=Roseibium sp. SCP14 TaxID=3141375 RepID=UPI003336ED7B